MYEDIQQGSEEWKKLRLGRVTASRVADIVAKTKSGYSTSRANYAAQLICERLTGVPTEGFTNDAMRWGTETEPQARAAYEFYKDVDVRQVAFVLHPTIGDTGSSPDGLVGEDGLVEIKAPLTATHIETLKGKSVPQKYVTQIQWQLACTGRQWCDFVSFDPRMPENMQFFCVRVHRVPEIIEELEKEVIAFLKEVRETIEALQKEYGTQLEDTSTEILMAG